MGNNFEVGRLGYNSEKDRYGILVSDLWEIEALDSGDKVEVYYNDEWINDRIEYNDNLKSWYLVESNLVGEELAGLNVMLYYDDKYDKYNEV